MPRLYQGRIKLSLVPLAPKKAPRVPWAVLVAAIAIGGAVAWFIRLRGR